MAGPPVDLMRIAEEQLKNNPEELKKLKKKMKKWGKTMEGQKKIQRMLSAVGTPPTSEEETKVEPRDALRARLKAMKDKRTGRA